MLKKDFLIILGIVLVAYAPLIGKKTYSPDAHIILPQLFEISSPIDYLNQLASFETVDFQPVRDLTFFCDIGIYKLVGISTFTLTNIFFWALSCLLLFHLLKRVQSRQSQITLLFLISTFAVYPLFTQAIAWTMARKHLVALFFILLSTGLYLDWLENKRKWISSYLSYVAAALSHPIVLFWPCWAIFYHWVAGKKHDANSRKFFSIVIVTMVALLLTNYAYYVVLNERLYDYYTHARPSFSLLRFVTHAGFYFREILFPYRPAFTYVPDFSNSWPGLLLLVSLGVFLWKQRQNRQLLGWIFFALFPFPVFIGLSVYDQYLLIPATGLFISVIFILPEIRNPKYFVVPLILVWGALTFRESSRWTDPGEIVLRNFRNAPSCKSAVEATSIISQTESPMPSEVLTYFEEKNCFSAYSQLPPAERPKIIVAKSLSLFYRTVQLSINEQENELKLLGNVHYYPLLVYSVLMAQKGDPEEVKKTTEFIYSKVQGPVANSGPLVENVLSPFCRTHGLSKCLVLLEGKGPDRPWL